MATVKGNRECSRCDLHKSVETVCLMGRGPIPSKVMAVGEAPGRTEDEVGRPFQGMAGDILQQACDAAGWPIENFYITNTVRCRPPNNKKPLKRYIIACSKWMEKEFRIVNPQFVLLLGRTALKTCPPWSKVKKLGDVLGKTIKHDGTYYMAVNHPAACLHQADKRGRKKAEFMASIKNFFAMVENGSPIKQQPLNKKVVRTPERFNEMITDIQANEFVALDCETMGLDQWDVDQEVVLVQVGTETTQWVMPVHAEHTRYKNLAPFKSPKARLMAMQLLGDVLKQKKIITQWGKFDVLWFLVKYKIALTVWLDTGLLAHILDENRPCNLNYLSSFFCGAPNYDVSVPEKQGYGITLKKHSTYAARDVYYTRIIAFKLLKELAKDGRLEEFFWAIPMKAYRKYRDIEYTGMYLDPKQFEVATKCFDESGSAISKLMVIAPEVEKWGSPQQISRLLFDRLKLPILEYTDTTKMPRVNESVLKRLAAMKKKKKDRLVIASKNDKLILGPIGKELIWFKGYIQDVPSLIIKYRKAKKQGDFVRSWMEHSDKRRRIHPNYKFMTVTGRPSCEKPNIQQVPRDPVLRSCFNAPPGWTMVAGDYSQIELRLVAMASNDPMMLQVYQTGGDIHAVTAERISGKVATPETRKRAKAVNFGYVYGMWWKKFMIYSRDNFDVVFSEEEAQADREGFFQLYNRLPRWQSRMKKIARNQGYVRALAGRKRNLPAAQGHDQLARQEAERQAINSPIQGQASDMLQTAMIEVSNAFPRSVLRPCATIHDELLMWVRNDHVEESLPLIKSLMENLKTMEKLGVRFTVPIIVDLKIGAWGKGKVWKSSIS